MTFGAFFSLMLARGMRLREELFMQDVLSYEVAGRITRTIVQILFVTAAVECVGTAALYLCLDQPAGLPRLYHSVFHAVSAFCNAGFSLYATSMEGYVGRISINTIMMALIVVGGLGFLVHQNLIDLLRERIRELFAPKRFLKAGDAVADHRDGGTGVRHRPVLLLQTKLVLATTGTLLAGGFVVFLLLEWNHGFQTLGLKGRLLAAGFQSVTTRTAGFDTVSTAQLTPASQFLSVLMMLVGASPGSTGGGIKTTTFAIMLLAVIAIIRNRGGVEAFGRSIAGDLINKAITVTLMAGLVVAGATVLMLVLESSHQWSFLQVLFEVMSAFGTVGLSLGITGGLTVAGKLLLCLVMVVGRIGPLTLVLTISQPGPKPAYEYPRGTVMVG
jgi:trk system potassium uptake protein TrkH